MLFWKTGKFRVQLIRNLYTRYEEVRMDKRRLLTNLKKETDYDVVFMER